MALAFLPGLGGVLFELPIKEAGAESGCDGLGLLGAVVVAEVVVGESEGLGEHPSVGGVDVGDVGGLLGVGGAGEDLDGPLFVAVAGVDEGLEVAEGHLGEDCVTQCTYGSATALTFLAFLVNSNIHVGSPMRVM